MKRLTLMLIVLLALTACVEYDEELWLNPDGSGKARIRLVHRSNYVNTEEIMNKAELPGIHLVDSQVSRVGENVVYSVTFKFDSLEAFNNINDQISSADFWGKITLNQEPGGNLIFKRRISLGSQEEEFDGDDILEGIYSQQQTKHPVWSYKIHLPWKILATNALAENTDLGKKTISWSYDTLQMWNRYEVMSVEMKKGRPWFVYVLGILVALLLAAFVYWLIRISKRSHLKDSIKHRQEQEEAGT